MKTENKMPDSEILKNVISELKMTKNAFAKSLNYKSSMSIYNIAKGQNTFTEDMRMRIKFIHPQVNYNYLLKGEKPILNTVDTNETNSKLSENKIDNNKRESIPERLERMEQMLIQILDRL